MADTKEKGKLWEFIQLAILGPLVFLALLVYTMRHEWHLHSLRENHPVASALVTGLLGAWVFYRATGRYQQSRARRDFWGALAGLAAILLALSLLVYHAMT